MSVLGRVTWPSNDALSSGNDGLTSVHERGAECRIQIRKTRTDFGFTEWRHRLECVRDVQQQGGHTKPVSERTRLCVWHCLFICLPRYRQHISWCSFFGPPCIYGVDFEIVSCSAYMYTPHFMAGKNSDRCLMRNKLNNWSNPSS